MISTRRRAVVCAAGTGDRVVQAAVGVLIGAFALSSLREPLPAALAAIGAALLLVGAARGWCPAALLARASRTPEPNALGIPESREPLER